ncbi:MAG: biotin--[acetyl-CoA-carboxylase] ligase [Rhodothermaceae bacterium]
MLNIEDFDIKLCTDVLGRNFIYTEEIESTNKALLNSTEFDKDGTVLLAEYQTAGKGRKSRVWYSNSGQNLTFSTLLKKDFKENELNIINLGAALSVAVALENLYQLNTNLKWPNDVLINERKIAGILIETTVSGSKIDKAVIGIGINVNQHAFANSTEYHLPPTSVKNEFGKDVSRERILSEVLNNFEDILRRIETEPQKVLADWKSRSRFLGENIKIVEDGVTKFGKFADLDENGFLVLQQGDETETIHFGDVSSR